MTDAGNDLTSLGMDDKSTQLFCMCFFVVASTFLGFGWRRNDENHVETLAGFRSVCVVDMMMVMMM